MFRESPRDTQTCLRAHATKLYHLGIRVGGGVFLVMGPRNVDFARLYRLHLVLAFFGTSENVVATQVWMDISAYVLVAIVKKRLAVETSFHITLQISSLPRFEKLH